MVGLVRFLTALVFLFAFESAAYADKLFSDDEIAAIMRTVKTTQCEHGCTVQVDSDSSISVRRFDINNDGKKEYIISSRDMCGSAGCPVAIVLQEGSRYREIFESFAPFILNTRTHGFRDILVNYKGPDYATWGPAEILKWNGHDYVHADKRAQTGPRPQGISMSDLYKRP